MLISLEWIGQYVDLSGLTPEEIAHRLTMSTAEVEGVEALNRACDGVVVGEIVEAEPIPDSQSLTYCRVNCGDRTYSTVCGACNARAGLMSAFAPAGARIAGGQVIERGEIAGRPSEGILCSARELGWSEFHEGILEIPASTPAGTPLSALVPASDTLVDIDNKSLTHRPDLWGQYGFAREVAAIFRRDLKPLPLDDLAQYTMLPAYPLEVADYSLCPLYTCIEMDNIAPAPSPLSMQWRLHALGQRTFNLLVDLTNYIMFEIGQPTHAFDGGKLKKVRVAPLGTNASFVTLDNVERRMLPEDLMIWNEREPVALAGVMGGLNSEVTGETKKLLLESANFHAARIRRTAVRLGLRSEASMRFEKSQPPMNARTAVARCLRLMKDAGVQPHVLSRMTEAGDPRDRFRFVDVPLQFALDRIGMPIAPERMQEILRALGFSAEREDETLRVGIPPHRSEKDISLPIDIVEEISRVYGYDNIAPQLPDAAMKAAQFTDRLRREHKARRLLAQAHGFLEIHSYSWFDDKWLEALAYDPGPTLELANPAAEHQRRLRTTLVPNLLAMAAQNHVHAESFRLFELGRVYAPAGQNGCAETRRLAGASFRQGRRGDLESHFREARGALEDLFRMLNAPAPDFEPAEDGAAPWEQRGQCARIRLNGKPLGALGYLSGSLLDEFGANAQVVWFELDFDALDGPVYPDVKYLAASPFPGSWFDMSIVWPESESYKLLQSRLDRFAHPLLRGREFVGHYKGKGLEPGEASYTFRFWIGSPDRTLTGDEIQEIHAAFTQFFAAEGLRLR